MSLPASVLGPDLEDPFKPKENYYAASNPCGMVFRVKEDFWHGRSPAGLGSRLDIKKGERGMCILHVNMPHTEWMQVKVSRDNEPTFGWVPRACLDIFRKPQGYPCRAKRDVTANPTAQKVRPKDSPPVISVTKGTEGTVGNHLDFKDDQGRAMTYCLVETFHPKNVGWIPLNDLEIGPRPVRMEITENRVSDAVDRMPTKEGEGSLLFNTIVAMLSKWRYEYAPYDLGILQQKLEKQIPDPSAIGTVANAICHGVKEAGLDQVFEKKDFTLQDMEKHAKYKAPGKHHKLRSVYCIRYSFEGNQKDKFYIGSSSDIEDRTSAHESATVPNSTSNHYKAAYEATGKQVFAICVPHPTNFTLWRTIMEQFFISALDAYTPRVLDSVNKLYDEYAADHKYAVSFRQTARDVSVQTGWGMPFSRPSSASFGAQHGLNFKSPLVDGEMLERIIWTRMDTPGGLARFQRPRMKVPPKYFVPFCISFMSKNDDRTFATPVNISGIDDLEVGDEVFPVVEIRLDNQPHRMPFALLPDVGHFTDWHLANTVGLYFDWKGRKGWHRYWVLSARRMSFVSSKRGELLQYVRTMALRNYLLQLRQVDPRDGQLDLGIGRIIQFEHDHFLQTNRISHRIPAETDVYEKPERKSITAVGNELLQLGVGRVGGTPGIESRKACDACYIHKFTRSGELDHFTTFQTNPNQVRCEREDSEDETCRSCYFMGRPCTWTKADVLRHNSRLLRALTFLPVPSPQREDISDPGHGSGDTVRDDLFIPVRKK